MQAGIRAALHSRGLRMGDEPLVLGPEQAALARVIARVLERLVGAARRMTMLIKPSSLTWQGQKCSVVA